MKRVAAALTRFAAICGLLVAPSAAAGQLQCNASSSLQIRSVKFTGNTSFDSDELALHVLSTPSDVSERIPRKRKAAIGAGVGALAGLLVGRNDRALWALGGAGVGAGIGYAIGEVLGTQRCLRPGLLSSDILNLRAFYYDQGFRDVRVDTAVSIVGQLADVTFAVAEGQPIVVDSLNLTAFDSTFGKLPENLNSRPGSRYSVVRLQADINALETMLRNSGYPVAQVLQNVTFPTSLYHAVVGFTFVPGPRARIGRIDISDVRVDSGPASVSEKDIREQLRFAPGDVYSDRLLFESERAFYRVGSFLSVDVAPDTRHVYTDSLVDVRVILTEDLSKTGTVEPGYGTLDCLRFKAGYTDRAFLHGLNRLDLSGSISKLGRARPWPVVSDFCKLTQEALDKDISSSEVNYNATVQLTRPVTLHGGLLPSFSAYSEVQGGYKAYLRTTIIGGAATVSKRITRSILWDQSYNLEYGHTVADESVLCFLFLACDQSARNQLASDSSRRLAVLGTRFSRDVRNNPDSTTSGSFSRLELRFSNRLLLSDEILAFNKGVVDAGWYHRAFGGTVFAVRFRAGLVTGATSINNVDLPPLQERLFTGGQTTVRGFQQNELGPLVYTTQDDTSKLSLAPNDSARIDSLQTLRMRVIPAGGNAMYVGNLEIRSPLVLSALQAIAFVDVGALSSGGPRPLGQLNRALWTPGIAVKYFSPIGPIQVNLGYNKYPRSEGPVYFDQFTASSGTGGSEGLICLSKDASGVCRSVSAIAPPTNFWKRLTLTVAFPPDF